MAAKGKKPHFHRKPHLNKDKKGAAATAVAPTIYYYKVITLHQLLQAPQQQRHQHYPRLAQAPQPPLPQPC